MCTRWAVSHRLITFKRPALDSLRLVLLEQSFSLLTKLRHVPGRLRTKLTGPVFRKMVKLLVKHHGDHMGTMVHPS